MENTNKTLNEKFDKEFEVVIGYEPIKMELKRIIDIMLNPDKYKKLGVTTPRGVLFNGEPGLGKTLMANCFIKASGRKMFVCRKDKSNEDFVKEIKNVFEEAKKMLLVLYSLMIWINFQMKTNIIKMLKYLLQFSLALIILKAMKYLLLQPQTI